MRGRLIQKFVIDIARLNEAATAAVVGGGYDSDFHEALPVPDGTQTGASSKRYHDVDTLPCQLDRENWGRVVETRGGENIKADIVVVLHRPDLERLGLLNTAGQPVFKRGDRVIEIRNRKGGVEEQFDDPPGMFVDDMDTAGHGLAAFGTPRQNLLYLYCKYDMKGSSE